MKAIGKPLWVPGGCVQCVTAHCRCGRGEGRGIHPRLDRGDARGGEGKDSDMSRVPHPPCGLARRHAELSVLWVSDEEQRPLVQCLVGEREKVVVVGHQTKPEGDKLSASSYFYSC